MCSRETTELNSIFLWQPKVHNHAIARLPPLNVILTQQIRVSPSHTAYMTCFNRTNPLYPRHEGTQVKWSSSLRIFQGTFMRTSHILFPSFTLVWSPTYYVAISSNDKAPRCTQICPVFPLHSSISSQKQTSQQHTVSGQSLSTRFPLFFCGGKKVDNSNASSYEAKKEDNPTSTPHTCLQRTATSQM